MNEDLSQSLDNSTEPPEPERDIDTGQGILSEDNDRPAAPADDLGFDGALPPDHPITDTDIDEHELYDQGLANSSGANDDDERERGTQESLEGL